MNNQGNLSPRYVEVGPDGKILRQSDTIPFEVETTYLNSQRQMTTNNNNTYPIVQSTNYPILSIKNKRKSFKF